MNRGDIVFEQLASGNYIMKRNRFGSLHSGIKDEEEVMSYVRQGIEVEVIRSNGSKELLNDNR